MLDVTKEEDIFPTQLSFSQPMRHVIAIFMFTPIHSASKLPVHFDELLTTLRLFILPDRH